MKQSGMNGITVKTDQTFFFSVLTIQPFTYPRCVCKKGREKELYSLQ